MLRGNRDWSLVPGWLIASGLLTVGLCLLLGLVGKSIWEACLMSNAVQVEGRLLSVEPGSGGSRIRCTSVLYCYEFGGVPHLSDRLALFKQTGSYYEPLRSDLIHHRPILVWVDPDHPRRAFIDREFVIWPFAAGLVFSLGWTTMGLCSLRRVWRSSGKDSGETIIRRTRRGIR